MTLFEPVPRAEGAPAFDLLGEGPAWDAAAGRLRWVDIARGLAFELEPGSGALRTIPVGGHVSAVLPCEDGAWMLARSDGLHRFDPASGSATPYARPDPDAGNRANECRTDPQGRVWLATMSNNLTEEGGSVPLRGATGGLFRVDGPGRSAHVLEGIGIGNTLVWSPAGDRLYFADSLLGVIWRFPFDAAAGELGKREVFAAPDAAPGVPDGSAMDEEGCLWNARWGAGVVVRFTPDGRVDRRLEVGVLQPTCPTFGGPDGRDLDVTSARIGLEGLSADALDGALLRTRCATAGAPVRAVATSRGL